MQFTDHFEVIRTTDDDWFDPILTVDTKLGTAARSGTASPDRGAVPVTAST